MLGLGSPWHNCTMISSLYSNHCSLLPSVIRCSWCYPNVRLLLFIRNWCSAAAVAAASRASSVHGTHLCVLLLHSLTLLIYSLRYFSHVSSLFRSNKRWFLLLMHSVLVLLDFILLLAAGSQLAGSLFFAYSPLVQSYAGRGIFQPAIAFAEFGFWLGVCCVWFHSLVGHQGSVDQQQQQRQTFGPVECEAPLRVSLSAVFNNETQRVPALDQSLTSHSATGCSEESRRRRRHPTTIWCDYGL